MFGALRQDVANILSAVCKMEGVTIIKAAVMPDHVHMYVSIPPKLSVSKVMGRIKGKSALMLFDAHPEYKTRYGRHFWARGYYVETIGNVNEENFWARGYYVETIGNVNEETIKRYIEKQYEADRLEGDSPQ